MSFTHKFPKVCNETEKLWYYVYYHQTGCRTKLALDNKIFDR